MTIAPIFTIQGGVDGYVIYCDAFRVGLDCVLLHQGKVIIYASKQLKGHQKKYVTHELELAAVAVDLMIWKHYLHGVCVDLFIDNKIF